MQGSYVNLTGDAALLDATAPHVDSFLSAVAARASSAPLALDSWAATLPRSNEALVVPTQVNYVGKAANLYEDAGFELNGAAYVINNNLGMTHIWDRVRVMGGAYGGFCSFDSHSGMFQYLSYRYCPPTFCVPLSCVAVCALFVSCALPASWLG